MLWRDEPSAGLDPRTRRELSELVRTLPQSTMIVAPHDRAFVTEGVPPAFVLTEGWGVTDEVPSSLLADHGRP